MREASSKELLETALGYIEESLTLLKASNNNELNACIEHVEHLINELKEIPQDDAYWEDFEPKWEDEI